MLCHKIIPTRGMLKARNTMFHGFCGLGISKQHHWGVSWECSQMSTGLWSLDSWQDCRPCFQGGSPTYLAGWCWLQQDSFPCSWAPHRVSITPYSKLPEGEIQKIKAEASLPFITQTWMSHLLPRIYWSHRPALNYVGEDHKGTQIPGGKDPGASLEVSYHSEACQSFAWNTLWLKGSRLFSRCWLLWLHNSHIQV